MPNPLIAVIVNSMEEVRRLGMTEGLSPDHDVDGGGVPGDLRVVIAELERELRISRDDDPARADR